jgi:phosphonopyruvate decarboxylase
MIKGLSKTNILRNLINSNKLEYLMDAHNGMSAKIVEESGFGGIWASRRTMAASMGLPKDEPSSTQIINNVENMIDTTQLPILVDIGNGFGDFNNSRKVVSKLERIGAAGVCIEDSLFPKSQRYIDGEREEGLVHIEDFSSKLLACKDVIKDDNFSIIVGINSLTLGNGMRDAIYRTNIYSKLGIDGIILASNHNDTSEIFDFLKKNNTDIPIMVMPNDKWRTPIEEYKENKISTIIWQDHNMRASITAMKQTTKQLHEDKKIYKIGGKIEKTEEMSRLQREKELKDDEYKFHRWFMSNGISLPQILPQILNKREKIKDMRMIELCNREKIIEKNIFAGQMIKRNYHTYTKYTELERTFLKSEDIYKYLLNKDIDFYTGVPDSLLKDYLAYIDKTANNIVVANEGLAVSLAAGYNIATNKIPCVYLQNSGLGNIINPLMSLINKKVYDIPILFLIGWRGEPFKKDEPQHLTQGEITEDILKACNIKYSILPDEIDLAKESIDEAVKYMRESNNSYVYLVKRQTFEEEKYEIKENKNTILRINAIKIITELFKNDIYVSTTGFTSRELYTIRQISDTNSPNDILVVGSMGHCSSIANGIALFNKQSNKKVICLDGDGSTLMHMGNLTTIGSLQPKNLIHFVFNNGTHESVGGQVLENKNTNLCNIARSCGYKECLEINTEEELKSLKDLKLGEDGPVFIEVKIKTETIDNLGRPKKLNKNISNF